MSLSNILSITFYTVIVVVIAMGFLRKHKAGQVQHKHVVIALIVFVLLGVMLGLELGEVFQW